MPPAWYHCTWFCPDFSFFFGGTWFSTQGFTLAKQTLYHLSHTSGPFQSGYFGEVVSQTISRTQPQTTILLISASQVARITSMSHLCPAVLIFTVLFH
jgi:homogentisate 1,2-dioxygenase